MPWQRRVCIKGGVATFKWGRSLFPQLNKLAFVLGFPNVAYNNSKVGFAIVRTRFAHLLNAQHEITRM